MRDSKITEDKTVVPVNLKPVIIPDTKLFQTNTGVKSVLNLNSRFVLLTNDFTRYVFDTSPVNTRPEICTSHATIG